VIKISECGGTFSWEKESLNDDGLALFLLHISPAFGVEDGTGVRVLDKTLRAFSWKKASKGDGGRRGREVSHLPRSQEEGKLLNLEPGAGHNAFSLHLDSLERIMCLTSKTA